MYLKYPVKCIWNTRVWWEFPRSRREFPTGIKATKSVGISQASLRAPLGRLSQVKMLCIWGWWLAYCSNLLRHKLHKLDANDELIVPKCASIDDKHMTYLLFFPCQNADFKFLAKPAARPVKFPQISWLWFRWEIPVEIWEIPTKFVYFKYTLPCISNTRSSWKWAYREFMFWP